ncbi:hypothetical protein PS15m_010191 [Mucor circinelloides]
MGQILSSIGVRLPGYLQFIFTTIFPSLLLIAQLYYICYVVNKQRDDAIHEQMRLHQKKYFDGLKDVHKILNAHENDKRDLLFNFQVQKGLTERAFKREMSFMRNLLTQHGYRIRITSAALDETTARMNTVYKSFADNHHKMNNEIRGLVATNNVLIEKVDRLQFANRDFVPTSIKRACQSLNINKRSTTMRSQVTNSRKGFPSLNFGKKDTVLQAQAPSAGTGIAEIPTRNRSTGSNVKKSIRRSYDRVVNMKKRASLTSMMSTLRSNLRPEQHLSDNTNNNNGVSYASSSSSNSNSGSEEVTNSSTSATTVSTSALESRIDSLYLAFSNQLKDINTKIDQLSSKVKKSRHSKATTTDASASGSSSQQTGDSAPLDLQVAILRDQVDGFHKEFIAMEKDYKKNIEALYRDIEAVSTKQKELDAENRSRWLKFDEFSRDSRGKFAEIFGRYEATTAFQMKKIADVSNYSESNIRLLHDTTKRHHNSLASLAQTLGQLEKEINEAVPFDNPRTATNTAFHKKQQEEDPHLIAPPSPANFINHIESSLKTDKAILDHNSKKLHALQHQLESSREAENLRVQRELVDREMDNALKQIAFIKGKIESEFESPPSLCQNGESSNAFNQRRGQFLRQV